MLTVDKEMKALADWNETINKVSEAIFVTYSHPSMPEHEAKIYYGGIRLAATILMFNKELREKLAP